MRPGEEGLSQIMAAVPKLLFKRGEVCDATGVQPHVLRTWEDEFGIAAVKSAAGHRLYRQSDIDLILKIKTLVFDQGLTISGARKRLEAELPKRQTTPPRDPAYDLLREVRQELRDLLTLLSADGKSRAVGT